MFTLERPPKDWWWRLVLSPNSPRLFASLGMPWSGQSDGKRGCMCSSEEVVKKQTSTSSVSLHASRTLGLHNYQREGHRHVQHVKDKWCFEELLRFRGSACYSNTQKSLLQFRVKVWTNETDHTLLRDTTSYASAPSQEFAHSPEF